MSNKKDEAQELALEWIKQRPGCTPEVAADLYRVAREALGGLEQGAKNHAAALALAKKQQGDS